MRRNERLIDETPVLPAVAARTLKVSPKGLRWLGDHGKIPYTPTGGDPSIRLYRWGDVVRVLERRGRARALRSKLPERARGMAKAQLALPLGRVRQVPTSAANVREFRRESSEVA